MATQGAYLVPRPHTPVFEKAYDEEFAAALDRTFDALAVEQLLRRTMYQEAADGWPIGHTPLEVKERRLAELRALDEMDGATSDEGSDRDEGDGATADGWARVEKTEPALERVSRPRPQEAHGLPTPPLSAHSPLPTPQGRKRRRDEEEEEEEHPRKAQVTSTARLDVPGGDKPNECQGQGRKRRRWRTDDVDNEGEGGRERPTKAQKTAAPTSRRRRRRPPKQPKLAEVEAIIKEVCSVT